MNKPDHSIMPALSLLLAATMWGLVWYPLRLLELQGLAGVWSTSISYAAVAVPGLLLLRGRAQELGYSPVVLLLMGLSAGWCNVAFILAVLDGAVVRVLLLFYLSPIWTVMLGWLLLGETLSARSLGVLFLAMIGAIVMLWDPAIGSPWPRDVADWLALSSGVGFALSNVLVRKLQTTSVQIKALANWLGVLLVALGAAAFTAEALPQVSESVIAAAVALGLLGFGVMTVAVQFGVTRLPVHRSAVILLFELVVGAVSAVMLADEVITVRDWIGGALIISAAWFAAYLEPPADAR